MAFGAVHARMGCLDGPGGTRFRRWVRARVENVGVVMFDHEKCQTCGGEILGGHDTAVVLPSSLSSFHVQHHLSCYMAPIIAAEREACAKIAEGEINGDFRTLAGQPGDYDNVCVQSKLAGSIASAIRARGK